MDAISLLTEIASGLQIKKAAIESEDGWKQRVILSTCSAWLLSGIRNTTTGLSVTHLKSILNEKVFAYLTLFLPDMATIENLSKEISEYIYDIHLAMGSFYHRAYYTLPAKERMLFCSGVKWYRSPVQPTQQSYSGLGTYSVDEESKSEETLEKLFSSYLLTMNTPGEILNQLMTKRHWSTREDRSPKEYLNIFRRFGEGYYTTRSPKSNDVILSRESTEHGHRYVLLTDNSQYEIQHWEQEEHFHKYIALAIMQKHQRMEVQVIGDRHLVKLALNYSLPIPEENFLRLYGWPSSLSKLNDRWAFSVMPTIYPAIKHRLQHLGFSIKEGTKHE